MSKAAAAGAAGGASGITTAGVLTAAAVVGGGYLLLRTNPTTGVSPLSALLGGGPEGAPSGLEGFLQSLGLGGGGEAPSDLGDLGPDGIAGTVDDATGSVADQIADFLDPQGTGYIDQSLLPTPNFKGLDNNNDGVIDWQDFVPAGTDLSGLPGAPGAPGEPGRWDSVVAGATDPYNLGVALQFTAAGAAAGAAAYGVKRLISRKPSEPMTTKIPKVGGAGEGGNLGAAGEGAAGTERTVSTRAPQQAKASRQAAGTTQTKEPTVRSKTQADYAAARAEARARQEAEFTANRAKEAEFAKSKARVADAAKPKGAGSTKYTPKPGAAGAAEAAEEATLLSKAGAGASRFTKGLKAIGRVAAPVSRVARPILRVVGPVAVGAGAVLESYDLSNRRLATRGKAEGFWGNVAGAGEVAAGTTANTLGFFTGTRVGYSASGDAEVEQGIPIVSGIADLFGADWRFKFW